MNKKEWYYENSKTGEICNDKWLADFWALDGIPVNYWKWSDIFQEWIIMMVREP